MNDRPKKTLAEGLDLASKETENIPEWLKIIHERNRDLEKRRKEKYGCLHKECCSCHEKIKRKQDGE